MKIDTAMDKQQLKFVFYLSTLALLGDYIWRHIYHGTSWSNAGMFLGICLAGLFREVEKKKDCKEILKTAKKESKQMIAILTILSLGASIDWKMHTWIGSSLATLITFYIVFWRPKHKHIAASMIALWFAFPSKTAHANNSRIRIQDQPCGFTPAQASPAQQQRCSPQSDALMNEPADYDVSRRKEFKEFSERIGALNQLNNGVFDGSTARRAQVVLVAQKGSAQEKAACAVGACVSGTIAGAEGGFQALAVGCMAGENMEDRIDEAAGWVIPKAIDAWRDRNDRALKRATQKQRGGELVDKSIKSIGRNKYIHIEDPLPDYTPDGYIPLEIVDPSIAKSKEGRIETIRIYSQQPQNRDISAPFISARPPSSPSDHRSSSYSSVSSNGSSDNSSPSSAASHNHTVSGTTSTTKDKSFDGNKSSLKDK